AARAKEVDFSVPYSVMSNSYIVSASSPIKKSADVDRSGVRVAAVKGQSQQIYLSENLKNAQVKLLTVSPSAEELDKMLANGDFDAYGANRSRLEEAVAQNSKLRVLPDNFSAAEQAIVVNKGDAASIEVINKFLEGALRSGLVKTSLERAKLTGVEP